MNYRPLLLCTLLLASLTIFAQNRKQMAGINGPPNLGGFGSTTVSGTVRALDGKPVQDARVEIRQFGTLQPVASGYTLPNGTFELANVPAGHYEIVVVMGLQETHEELRVNELDSSVDLRIANPGASSDGGTTVSVAQLKIPDKARKEFHKAEEELHKHKPDAAREHIQNALQIAPNYAAALSLRGVLDLGENRLAQASSECEQAIKFDPNYGMGYVVLGATYNTMARFEDAERALQHGLLLVPQSWQAHFELAKALLGKTRYQEALRQIDQAGELVPSSYPAIHLVRAHALLGLKNYSQAIAELEQYLGGAPNGVDAAGARETLDQTRAFAAAQGSK